MKHAGYAFLSAAFVFAAASIARADDPKPIRHLVYDFTVTISSELTLHSFGTGATETRGGNSDSGSIVADVLAVQPDSGLVVRISENGRGSRSSAPTMCVTYGTTGSVICDTTHGMPNEEEYSLLRVLGKDFVNDAMIDSKHHWRTSTDASGGNETNDYTIDNHNGDTDAISFQRVLDVQGVNGYNASTMGHITYNVKTSVPTGMTENTTTRRNTGQGNYETVDHKMTFTLASDSLAQNH